METQFIVAVGAIFFIWLLILSFLVYRMISHYNHLIDRSSKGNLQSVLEKLLEEQKTNHKEIIAIQEKIVEVQKTGIKYIQKVGILRYNPFEDTGGDQSFVLVILDGEDTGIVLTSLHSRGVSRWYAKNIRGGKGIDHELSKEEEKAIKNAVKIKA